MSNPLMNEKNHGLDNCNAWYESIIEMLNNYDKARKGEIDDKDDDDIRQEIEESVLSVEIRTEWYVPGTPQKDRCYEYMILLSTGGPACRIIGDLNQYMEPETAKIQYQDWFTKWETMGGTCQSDLIRFASFFYFGE